MFANRAKGRGLYNRLARGCYLQIQYHPLTTSRATGNHRRTPLATALPGSACDPQNRRSRIDGADSHEKNYPWHRSACLRSTLSMLISSKTDLSPHHQRC